ncbi:hypothetical protein BBJ28_00013571 [Nothophytophthora sp. Chile5]|nr:hypothetical protein BBJ28_00013571 [Nothophytophthora sp. Chile5]
MRKWKANSYVLSVCLLVAEYVRQHQQDAQRGGGEDSVSSLSEGRAAAAATAASAISKTSLNELARFLCDEIQHPTQSPPGRSGDSFTSLKSLLWRLERAIDSETDYERLSWVLTDILTKIDSPDAVWNVVDQISDCVAPLAMPRDEEEEDALDLDSANSTLARTSLLGVFVRSFLLAVSRLLFDGLSRLFDDVTQYLEHFREEYELEKKGEEHQLQVDEAKLNLLSSPQASATAAMTSQHLWKEDKQGTDELLLSPIFSGSATLASGLPPTSRIFTPAPSHRAPDLATEDAAPLEPRHEHNDSAVWSNDQLNYILSDMVRDMERGRRNQQGALQETTQGGHSLPREQMRPLLAGTNEANPNVLFVKYLSFLRCRDYQGALDSLHQYHDVLPPRQDPRQSINDGADGSPSAPAGSVGGAGLHFRGTGIQYAVLNLAGLQIMFDHYTAAQESIQEAIRVAQHHGDHICVAFALTWLVRINQKLGKSKDVVLALVVSCLDRAEELRLPSLQVLATLTEAESELTRGSTSRPESLETSQLVSHVFAARAPGPRPLHIWSWLYETTQTIATMSTPPSSLQNNGARAMNALQAQMNNHQMASGGNSASQASQNSNGTAWMKSTGAILDTVWKLSGKVTLSVAVGWGLFGQRTLGKVFNRIYLMCYEDSSSVGEIALAVSNMAMSNLAEVDPGENVYAHALRFLLGVVSGSEDAAAWHHLIDEASFQRTLHNAFFLWALRRGEFVRAEVHLNAILALSPSGKDFPSHLEALLLKAKLSAAQGDFSRSLTLAEKLATTCNELGYVYLYAQVLVVIGQVRFRAAAPHAPFASLNVLLTCMGICRAHRYDLLLAEAHVVMAEMYMAMGKLQDAYSLVNDQMPLVMEHGSVHLRGECLLVLAKIMVASIKRSKGGGSEEASPAVSKVVELLDASADMHSSLQDLGRLKEISYVQSLVHNHMVIQAERCGGDAAKFIESREQAATASLKYAAQLKRAPFRSVEPFFDLESPESIRQVIDRRSRELI